jgi:hypothetical protein
MGRYRYPRNDGVGFPNDPYALYVPEANTPDGRTNFETGRELSPMVLKIGMLSNKLSKIHRFPRFSDVRSIMEQLTVMLPILGALRLRSPQ